MRIALVGMMAAMLASCSWLGPPSALIDRIEARLSREPCIGALDRWSRHYKYGEWHWLRGGRTVWFAFIEAGHRGIAAGRYVNSDVFDMIDDSQHRVAFGNYDVTTGRISDWSCGANYPVREPRSLPAIPGGER